MNCRVLSRISLGTKHPPQYCGIRIDGTGIKINQSSEAWPVWSDQTNQVSRHPSWPGGLLNHTKSVPNILDLRQTNFNDENSQLFTWTVTMIFIRFLHNQLISVWDQINSGSHTEGLEFRLLRCPVSIQAVRFMSTVCPRPEECSQSEPSVLSLMSLKSRPIHLRVDSLSGQCLAVTTVFDLPLTWVVWTNNNADAPHQMQMSPRCYGL